MYAGPGLSDISLEEPASFEWADAGWDGSARQQDVMIYRRVRAKKGLCRISLPWINTLPVLMHCKRPLLSKHKHATENRSSAGTWPPHKSWLTLSGRNPLTAKLFNLNFHPLEVVSRWRDPQLQVSENYSDLTKWRSTLFKSCWLMSHFIFTIFKMWYLMCY